MNILPTIKNFPNNRDEYIGCEPVMKWLHGRTSGVFGADGKLAVSANDNMTVSVSDGPAWLSNAENDGCVIWNDTEETTDSKLTLDVPIANAALPRIDRVVASWDTIDYTALPVIEILQGTPASNPQPPALTNTTLKRQISLAQYRVAAAATKITAADITDERLDPEVCGLVTESVGIDTSVMQEQFTELLSLIQDQLARLNAGTETMTKTTYDPDGVGRNIFSDMPYLYRATLLLDGWEGEEAPYTQTVSLEPVEGGPSVKSTSRFCSGITAEKMGDNETDAIIAAGLNILNSYATADLGNGAVTVTTSKLPSMDLPVVWQIREV